MNLRQQQDGNAVAIEIFFLEREADRVNNQGKSIPDSHKLVPSEMMLVPEGGWNCSGGRAGDSSASSEGGGKGRAVRLCRSGHPLTSVALETESVLPAKSCWVSLVKDPSIQDT